MPNLVGNFKKSQVLKIKKQKYSNFQTFNGCCKLTEVKTMI